MLIQSALANLTVDRVILTLGALLGALVGLSSLHSRPSVHNID